VNNQPADSNSISGLDNPIPGITNQSPSQSLALKILVHCQTTKYDNRDWIEHVAAKSSRSFSYSNRTRRQSIISCDTQPLADNEDS